MRSMRLHSVVLIATLGLAASYTSQKELGECIIDGGEAINDAADAALFLWAAVKRCGKNGEQIKCEVDISSAIESVNGMVNIILKAVDRCASSDAIRSDCGLAASRLTEAVAGLSAASGLVLQKCPNSLAHQHGVVPAFRHIEALCVVDIKDTGKSLVRIMQKMSDLGINCFQQQDRRYCAENSLRIIGGFAALGEFISGAVGHCSSAPKHQQNALCSEASFAIVHHTSKVSAAATELSTACRPQPLQYYEQEAIPGISDTHGSASDSKMSFLIGALLPVTALVGFAGGRAVGKRGMHERADSLVSDTE